MNHFLKIIGTMLVASAALPSLAQTNGSNSPYSRYGLGLLSDGGNAFNKGMVGTAYGMRDGKEVNSKNPASYAAIDSLSFLFDFGLSLQNGNFAQGGKRTNARNTSVDYITTGFRLAKNLGMSLGMLPYSTVGYSMNNQKTLTMPTGDVTQTSTYAGDGGVHEVYAGIGWAPWKQLSIGLNAGYLWGDIDHSVLNTFSDADINSVRQAYSAKIRTYKVDLGLQYDQPINKKNSLTLGLVYGYGHAINSDASYYNQKLSGGSVVSGDSLTCSKAFGLPHTVGVGLTWNYKKQLRVGLDYTYQRWSDVKQPSVGQNPQGGATFTASTGAFTDLHRISLGAEYIPDENGVRWREHIRYRAGVAYTTPYVKIGGQNGPSTFTAGAGVALPIINMHNNRSFVNLSAQYERSKPSAPGMITENYIRFSIGLSFNERWFMKWKAE